MNRFVGESLIAGVQYGAVHFKRRKVDVSLAVAARDRGGCP